MPETTVEHSQAFEFFEPLVLLIAAIIFVSAFKRLGLGTVLGYLLAGVVVGPVLRLITDGEQILSVAELGVVFLLFVIGLELKPARLWSMRGDIFGLGLSQVGLTGVALTWILWLAGWRVEPAIIIGFGLALSSTAFGLQILRERNDLNRPYGHKALSILLFQDLAIVPLLIIVPLLSPAGTNEFAASGVREFFKIVSAIIVIYLAGRYLINPFFRLLAHTNAREIMVAGALLVVLAAAALTEAVGLSMAMGAFIAGVLLADSSFRHELEADIEPFRGVLLGLFFMAVGMSINVDTVLYSWWRILLFVPVLMGVKAGLLYGLNRVFGANHNDSVKVALLLPQAGEFAFVLFASAASVRALWPSDTSFVAAVVTLSIALTPLSVMLGRMLLDPDQGSPMEEDFDGAGGQVLMIGFGRFGQVVSQVLLARGTGVTIIDRDPNRIRQAARFGFRIYFGDGERRDVLRAAGAEKAAIICICVEDPDSASRILDQCRSSFPEAQTFVRTWDRTHTIDVIRKGATFELRETLESALHFGGETLRGLGLTADDVNETIQDIRQRDADRLSIQISGEAYPERHILHTNRIQPEPLTRPEREAEVLHSEPDPAADPASDDGSPD